MMKIAALLLLLAASSIARADELQPQTCNYYDPSTGTCSSPQLMFSDTKTTVVLDGVSYVGAGFPAGGTYANVPLYALDGSLIVLTAQFTYHSKLVRSGHSYYRHWWTLDSGTLVGPS